MSLAMILVVANLRPQKVKGSCFNPDAKLPYGLETAHIEHAMTAFVDFLAFINKQLVKRDLPPFEHFLMPANFSSIVGEFMTTTIPHACTSLVKNRYHNGHPDLVPAGAYKDDAILHGKKGIEVKASK